MHKRSIRETKALCEEGGTYIFKLNGSTISKRQLANDNVARAYAADLECVFSQSMGNVDVKFVKEKHKKDGDDDV